VYALPFLQAKRFIPIRLGQNVAEFDIKLLCLAMKIVKRTGRAVQALDGVKQRQDSRKFLKHRIEAVSESRVLGSCNRKTVGVGRILLRVFQRQKQIAAMVFDCPCLLFQGSGVLDKPIPLWLTLQKES
jgi:hypothetical protein